MSCDTLQESTYVIQVYEYMWVDYIYHSNESAIQEIFKTLVKAEERMGSPRRLKLVQRETYISTRDTVLE